jgi:predicted RNase H-like nuclease (RuvC/YqgF family)
MTTRDPIVGLAEAADKALRFASFAHPVDAFSYPLKIAATASHTDELALAAAEIAKLKAENEKIVKACNDLDDGNRRLQAELATALARAEAFSEANAKLNTELDQINEANISLSNELDEYRTNASAIALVEKLRAIEIRAAELRGENGALWQLIEKLQRPQR